MNPFPVLLLLFILVPLAEIYILIEVGSRIGTIPTVSLVVFTAVLGALLLRHQGLKTLQRVQATLGQGELPALEMMEGVALIIGGALLLTPGFVTDFIGFVCLIPPVRQLIIRRWMMRHVAVAGSGQGVESAPPGGCRTIEGEFKREDD
jgi:UPF0716 protein FxsA